MHLYSIIPNAFYVNPTDLRWWVNRVLKVNVCACKRPTNKSYSLLLITLSLHSRYSWTLMFSSHACCCPVHCNSIFFSTLGNWEIINRLLLKDFLFFQACCKGWHYSAFDAEKQNRERSASKKTTAATLDWPTYECNHAYQASILVVYSQTRGNH